MSTVDIIVAVQFIKINFNIKIVASCFFIGMCLSFWFFYNKIYLFLLCFILFILNSFVKYKHANKAAPYIAVIILSLTAGFAWSCWNIVNFKQRNQEFVELENHKILVRGIVTDVIYKNKNSVTFDFVVNNTDKIRLTGFNLAKNLMIGDCWQLYVKLKKPRNFFTPGSFDLEKHMFSQQIHAVGNVINHADNLLITPYKDQKFNYAIFLKNIRQTLVNKINNCNFINANIITTLTLGTKNNLAAKDIIVLQNTGTMHLLSISGLHISFIVGIGFWLANLLWTKLAPAYLLEKMPSLLIASSFGVLCAMLYASLSGLFVATLRAVIMTILYLCAVILRYKITKITIYYISLLFVLIIEPFAILTNGFWWSFIAVGILLYKQPTNLLSTNWAIFIGLLPINIFIFGKINIIAIIANLLVVPYFAIFILPWVFSGIIFYGICNLYFGYIMLKFADLSLQLLLWLLYTINKLAIINIDLAIPTMWALVLSVIGSIWLLLPQGLLNKCIAIVCFLPLFFNKPFPVKYGQAMVSFLDVGQGLAIVIKLQNNILLYDVGAANKVVVNYLKSFKQRLVDYVIISHPDFDHIGGLKDVVNYSNINAFITNKNYNTLGLQSLICASNKAWTIDGVTFKFFNLAEIYSGNIYSNNDNSCILKMSTDNFSILLTGDISKKAEKLLIANYRQDLKADLLLIPHHGSKYSSSTALIQAVQPKYAIVSAGYMNKYGHPRPEVINKYLGNNIIVFNTIEHGTIDFLFKDRIIDYNCYRISHKYYWNY